MDVSIFHFHGPLLSSWTYGTTHTLMFPTESAYDLGMPFIQYLLTPVGAWFFLWFGNKLTEVHFVDRKN
jgi:hypothetical protein